MGGQPRIDLADAVATICQQSPPQAGARSGAWPTPPVVHTTARR